MSIFKCKSHDNTLEANSTEAVTDNYTEQTNSRGEAFSAETKNGEQNTVSSLTTETTHKRNEIVRKFKKKILIIATPVVCTVIALLIIINAVIIPNKKYNDALALMNAGSIVETYEILIELDDYKDSCEKADSIYDSYKIEKIKVATAGDYIFFGSYEQNNNISDGKEDIEWLILEVKNGKALIISKHALDCKQYNTVCADVSWESCSLRKWLNNDFFNTAFSDEERAKIPTVTVSDNTNPAYNTAPGAATQDKVFLLSINQANKYFEADNERICKPTDYAVARGAWENPDGNCWWWLRSPGKTQDVNTAVFGDGDIYERGDDVSNDNNAVRPALWIEL